MFDKWRENRRILKRELEIVGKEYERKSYDELSKQTTEVYIDKVIEGKNLRFLVDRFDINEKNGDLGFCIEVCGLMRIWKILGWQFFKRKDGTVYY